ncbi:uncharacterized protein LOC132169309 [Corylus avellana]|uniref:uncharacterized protein LOC132169309 n=1 Tax=Corylus avellana TaxID=13451 RepID=UPI00286AF5BD|nr:uncharacterized protein LOC132169309 [Corylus avellana]
MEGLLWRVGDGKSIRIWVDKWIPATTTNKIQSPNISFPRDARLLQENFSEAEVSRICSLAICPGRSADQLVLGGTKNGEYTVRSAYHMAKAVLERENCSSSIAQSKNELWRKIWNLKGSKALQMFLWKAFQNILPTRENLYRRKISLDSLCPACGLFVESVGHILWSCQSARDVWLDGPRVLQKSTSDDGNFMEIVLKFMGKLDEENFLLFATIARQIWFRRNCLVHGGDFQAPAVVMRQARDQVENFAMAENEIHHEEGPPDILIRNTKWGKPPDQDSVKVNWDASISKDLGMMGVGVILRNHDGEVIASFCTSKPRYLEPGSAEPVGAWHATE